MTIKLISLVIIVLFLLSGHSNSGEQFLFPKKKPSIFKQIEKTKKIDYSNNLPQKKPVLQKEEVIEKEKIVEKKKVQEKNEVKEKKTVVQKSLFIFPQKKPSIYKASKMN